MKRIAVLTGAGISAESGIQTFRDANGLWENHSIEEVATPEGFARNPALVTAFYNKRRNELLRVSPNEAHKLVAGLEKWFDVIVITQNVDNLHERAGSSNVLHLHGELTKMCSSRSPGDPAFIRELRPEEYTVDYRALAGDGSRLRPFVVWFGEPVPNISIAAEQVSQADIVIIIGTSLQVYPAAGLIDYAKAGARIYLIDPKDVARNTAARNIVHIKEVATKGMRHLYSLLESER